jgi:hypothetical protein
MRVHGASYVLSGIERARELFESFHLTVTKRAADLELVPLYRELAATATDTMLTTEQATRLVDVMGSLQKTMYAVTSGHLAYIVSNKRYDVTRLVGDVRSLFAPHVFDSLPEVGRYDFAEAGKCIAFEVPTGAAFHLLRGTEDVLRTFYCQRIKTHRVKPLLWGPMVDGLRKRSKPPPIVLTNDLDNIRLQFRNPTQHPDKIYDIEEVQDLLGRCTDVVNRMMKLLG